jgi:hypothetical protein
MNDNEKQNRIAFGGHVTLDAPVFEGRTQTETQDLERCIIRGTNPASRIAVFESRLPFPSLPHWRFGLRAKEGVTLVQMRALAEQITNLCEQFVAHFDYQPVGLEYYERDKFGLAILEEDPHPPQAV